MEVFDPYTKGTYIPFRDTKQKYVRTTCLINKTKLFIISSKPPSFTMILTLANGTTNLSDTYLDLKHLQTSL